MIDREKLIYIRNQVPALRKFSERFRAKYPQFTMPSTLSGLKDWVLNPIFEILVTFIPAAKSLKKDFGVKNMRDGLFTILSCFWLSVMAARYLHAALLVLGLLAMEICVRLYRWADSALGAGGDDSVLGSQVGDSPRSTAHDLGCSDVMIASDPEASARNRDVVPHETPVSSPTTSGKGSVPFAQLLGVDLRFRRPWLEGSNLSRNLTDERYSNVFEFAVHLYFQLERERAEAWDKLRPKIMATWQQEFEPEDENCLICLNPYDDNHVVNREILGATLLQTHRRARTSCGHIFVRSCLFIWFDMPKEQLQTCPLCRTVTKKVDVVDSISRAAIEQKQWDSLKRDKVRLRMKVFSQHIEYANQLRDMMSHTPDEGSTPRAVYNSAWEKVMTAARAGKDDFIYLAGAQMCVILRSFWSGLVQDWLEYFVEEATRLVQVTKYYVGHKGMPSTKRFVKNTLVRMGRWNPYTESEELMKDFLDLYLLFMAWPNEMDEFEAYCAKMEEQDDGVPSGLIEWQSATQVGERSRNC